jgi:hypothetical protein
MTNRTFHDGKVPAYDTKLDWAANFARLENQPIAPMAPRFSVGSQVLTHIDTSYIFLILSGFLI